MAFRYEIRLSAEGGQGLVLAGKILAEAAAIYDERNATQSQSYGPEARGGASKSEVIIADGEIDYPKAEKLDLQLVLTQEALDRVMQFGELPTGGYFWRPPYINHGTFRCKYGTIPFGRTDSVLFNYFHYNPWTNPDENKLRAAAALYRKRPLLYNWVASDGHNHPHGPPDFQYRGGAKSNQPIALATASCTA